MVKIEIDGRQVMVSGHITILDAASKLGLHIPTFCHHPRLSELGACRMCLVEVEGMWKLQTACTLAVAEGMVIKTDSPRVEKARSAMLEFLLINHPLECTVCDASGECTLQDLTFKFGSADTRFTETKRVLRDHIISPLIDRNLNRCIQCKRCVRICDEVQGVTALGMSYRGARTIVGPFMDGALDCEYCGHCIWSCPVGAITSRVMKHKIRTWEMDKIEAICPFCSCGCTLTYNHRDKRVYRVTHAEGQGVNYGSLCSRGYFGYDVINSPERLETPLVRRDGKLVQATWEDALKAVAAGFSKAAKEGGDNAVGGIVSARLTNEELYLFQKLLRSALSSNSVDTTTGEWNRAVLPVLEERLGVFAATNSMDEMNYADFLLLVGCDITVENPISGIKIKSAIRKGARVAEVGSRRTALSRLADKTLLVKSGKELSLIKGVIRVIIDEELTDPELLGSFRRLDELRMSVLERDTKTVAEDVGVSAEEITDLARNFMSARNASVIFGEAVALTPDGPAVINALIDLLMLTGKMGQEGFGLYPVVSATNFQGAVDMGVSPAHLPGHVSVEKKTDRSKFDKAWKTELPAKPGLTAHQMLQAGAEGKLGALYVVGVDLAGSFPGGKTALDALSEVDFLVVQDLFMTETARRADVVLPAGALAEKNGTLTNMERRIQRTRKAVDGPGRSMPDWRIFSELGVALGHVAMKYVNAAEVLDEIAENVPNYSGINHRILADNGLQWPFTKEDAKEIYHEGYLGTRHLLGEGPGEKFRQFAAVSSWGETTPDKDYPHTLLSGEVLFHSGTYTRYSDSLNSLIAESQLVMNSLTGAGLGIEEGGLARVVSAHGELTLKSKFSDDLMEDIFFLPRHFADAPAGRLMGTDGDNTETAVVRVRVQRA